jgi:MFS family permease
MFGLAARCGSRQKAKPGCQAAIDSGVMRGMGEQSGLLARILPPEGLPRRLAVQSAVLAIGSGTFLTGSVVFFTIYVGLTPVQIGLGFSVAGFLGLAGNLPLGHLADRIGGRRAWVIGGLGVAVAFGCYPLARGFWSFVLVLALETLSDIFGRAGRQVYTAAVIPAESRVRVMAFMRAYLNVGFTIGSGLGAAALALDSRTGLLLLVLANAVGGLVNAIMVSRFPGVTARAGESSDGVRRPSPWGVLRDHPYTVLAILLAVLGSVGGMIFGELIPLWAVTMTDAPKPVLGGLFALNTVLAVLLQVRATRGADTQAGAVRLARWGALATAVACPVIALSGATHGLVTIAVLAAGVILVTAQELWGSAAQWFISTDVPPAAQRGIYMGLSGSMHGVTKMIGPAALTFLAIKTGGWGWWVIAALFVAVAVAIRPVMDWVGRTPRNGATLREPATAG